MARVLTAQNVSADAPAFRSAALDDLERLDYGDVIFATKPPRTTDDPRAWVETMFSLDGMPRWVVAAMGLRAMLAPLLRLDPAPKAAFDVARIVGEEAVIDTVDDHLTFRCAVGVDTDQNLVRVTTAVMFHNWRGRVYFIPVGVLHPIVVRAMLMRTRRVLARRRA